MSTPAGGSMRARLHLPGEPGYLRLRLSAAHGADWNLRTVQRYPAAILEARHERDVIDAVRLAREEGWTVKARSGGHSWTDSSVRNGSLLVDVSGMTSVAFNGDDGTAQLGPGVKGQHLDRALEPLGWYFPTGGCNDVGMGGYLLQGGFGFNRQVLGPACLSVRAADIVTAEGELVHADSTRNAGLFWAARGAGPGFFGIVTRFYVQLHRLPEISMSSTYLFPHDHASDVIGWLMDEHDQGRFPPELMVGVTVGPALAGSLGTSAPTMVMLRGSTSAGSAGAARDLLSAVDRMPLRPLAVRADPARRLVMSERRGLAAALYPDGGTYIADNMWTDASRDQLVPLIADCLAELPSRGSHLAIEAYHPHSLPDMAFSLEARYWLALYGVTHEPRVVGEDALVGWTRRHLARMSHLSEGIQLADENLIARPALGLRPDNAARLERLRMRHDPQALFESYLLAEETD